MGRDCYDLGFHKDFEGKKIFVATSKKLENYDNIHFINGDIVSIILEELKKDGKNIFLFGGGVTLTQFISRNIIDESDILIKLKLIKYLVDDGILILRYSKC